MTADTTPQEELRNQIAAIIEHARANATYFTNTELDAKANVEHETDELFRLIERKVLEGRLTEIQEAWGNRRVPTDFYMERQTHLAAQLNQLEGKKK